MNLFGGIGTPWLLALALLWIVGTLVRFWRRHPAAKPPSGEVGGDLVAAFLALFLGVIVSNQVLAGALLPAAGDASTFEWIRYEGLRHLPMLAFCILLLTLLWRRHGDLLGVSRRGIVRDVWLGSLLYAVLLLPVLAIHEVHERWVLQGESPRQAAVDHLLLLNTPQVLLFCVCVALITPLYEELLFRGLLIRGLRALCRGQGIPGESGLALVLSTALFTFIHPRFTWGPIFVLGAILGILYLRSGRLWLVISFHAAHNLCTVLYHLWQSKG